MNWTQARKLLDKGEKMRRSTWPSHDYTHKEKDTARSYWLGRHITMDDRLANNWEKLDDK